VSNKKNEISELRGTVNIRLHCQSWYHLIVVSTLSKKWRNFRFSFKLDNRQKAQVGYHAGDVKLEKELSFGSVWVSPWRH